MTSARLRLSRRAARSNCLTNSSGNRALTWVMATPNSD